MRDIISFFDGAMKDLVLHDKPGNYFIIAACFLATCLLGIVVYEIIMRARGEDCDGGGLLVVILYGVLYSFIWPFSLFVTAMTLIIIIPLCFMGIVMRVGDWIVKTVRSSSS